WRPRAGDGRPCHLRRTSISWQPWRTERSFGGILGLSESNRLDRSIEIRVPGLRGGEDPIEERTQLVGTSRADPFDLLQLGDGGVEEVVEAPEMADELLPDVVREAPDFRQQAIAAGVGSVVEFVDPEGPPHLRRIVEIGTVELFEGADRLFDR